MFDIANRKPSDFARLAVLAAIEDAERAAKPKGCPSCGAMHYPHADWCPASLSRPDTAESVADKCKAARGIFDRLAELASRPETAEPATGGGQVASKSIARRLAFSGGPPPACTCPMADSREEYGGHLSECPRGAYEAALCTCDPTTREAKTGRPFDASRLIDHGVECPRRAYLNALNACAK